MNILHLSTPKSWRGGEQQVYWLFEEIELLQQHKQLLVCPQKSVMQQKCIANNWKHITLKNAHHFNLVTIRFLAEIAKQNKIDIIHLHDAHALNMGILASCLFGMKIPMVFTRRVDFELNKNWFTRFKYNHFWLKKIICVSEKIKNVISKDIQLKSRLTTVHSGVDTKRFIGGNNFKNELKIDKTSILIGNASALSDHKDLITFVEVAQQIINKTNKKVHFVLIGEGKERSIIERRIKELKLTTYFTLTGFRNDIAEILPQLDIFLMTSKEEGLGTTVLDAMAAGVAVVSTNAGGLPESVLHQKTGLLANVADVKNLSNLILQLIENNDLKQTLETAAKNWVNKQFSKEKMAKGVLKVYDNLGKS